VRDSVINRQTALAHLIVLSLRVDVERAGFEAALAACGDIDWPRFFRCVDGHGVTPLVADRWQALGLLDRLPIEVRDRLLKARRDNAARNDRVRREVIEYWQLIAEANVPAILLKGWPLVEMLYHSPALRLITDMDLLIPAVHAPVALRALQLAGLEPLPANRDAWVEKHLPAYWRLNGRAVVYPLANMFDPLHPRSIELHTHLWETNFRGLRLGDPAGVWERSRVTHVAGCPMRTLSLDDILIHLCVHWACHWIEREARLIQLVDLDRFVRAFGAQLDWPLIARVSHQAQVTRFVFAALMIAHRTFGAPRPPLPITDELRAGCPPPLRRRVDRSAADAVALMDQRRPDKGAAYVLTWSSALGLREWLGVARYALLPPREFIIGRYRLKRRWLAIPFYIPYVLGRTWRTVWPFARALTRFARLGSEV